MPYLGDLWKNRFLKMGIAPSMGIVDSLIPVDGEISIFDS